MTTEIELIQENGKVEVGDIEYGGKFTKAPNNPHSFFIKLNERNIGSGITLDYPKGYCLVMNLRTGGIRAVPRTSIVTPLNCTIELCVPKNPREDNILKSGR